MFFCFFVFFINDLSDFLNLLIEMTQESFRSLDFALYLFPLYTSSYSSLQVHVKVSNILYIKLGEMVYDV